ncbi:MAG: DUF3006 domain-containing protein [Oscillospiraceae bacterium]
MRLLIVDRYEGQYTICEDQEQKLFAIETSEMPPEAAPGSAIQIDEDGIIAIDLKETQNRKNRILKKQAKLMQENH